MPDVTVTVRDGAYKISGGVTLVDDATGEPIPGGDAPEIFLCRCGGSRPGKLGRDLTSTPPGGRAQRDART